MPPAIIILVFILCTAFLAARLLRKSDGPRGPLPGGPLRAGEIVAAPLIDWSELGRADFAEIESLATGRSRMTGLIEHEGTGFIPCDLGFIWRRVSPPAKWAMAVVWFVKTWHKSVQADGRVLIRIRGKRYPFFARRVEDEQLLAALKAGIDLKAQALMGPRLSPREEGASEGEIWFFRLEPR